MRLAFKQLLKQIAKGKIFLFLMLLLCTLTSLSFFFVMFSIDGNIQLLNTLQTLSDHEQLYKNALESNKTLGFSFLVSLTGLTAFVFVMFFYRFYRTNKKQIGCLKSLGFKDSAMISCFVAFVFVLSFIGLFLGFLGGYFLSGVLINANTQTYAVTGLVRGIQSSSLIAGLFIPIIVFSLVAFFCYGFVRGMEPGVLLLGNENPNKFSFTLKLADKISRAVPSKKRFSLRIALRKPLSLVLIIVAVTAFTVCIILGRSLNISSAKVFQSQTIGHNYEYDTLYTQYQTNEVEVHAVTYLAIPVKVFIGEYEVSQTLVGLYHLNSLFELQNKNGDYLAPPESGTVYIAPGLSETFGVTAGDMLSVHIDDKKYEFLVSDIAVNAKSASFYGNGRELAHILGTAPGAYNGVLSIDYIKGGIATSKEQRIDDLNRDAVSNKISALINQATGGLVGAILIFLALYVNFQDNTRDILILHMMGYRIKEIRKLLIDVYLPIIWFAYIITLAPGILIAKEIQRSLSISTNDYMPFGTNGMVILIVFVSLNIIYWLVQVLFRLGIKRTIVKEEVTELI